MAEGVINSDHILAPLHSINMETCTQNTEAHDLQMGTGIFTRIQIISKSCVLQATSVAAQVCTDMDLFFSQLQSALQTCTASEVAEDKKTKFADDASGPSICAVCLGFHQHDLYQC